MMSRRKRLNRPGEKKFQQNRITSWLGQIQQKQLRNRFMRSRQKRHQRTPQKLQQINQKARSTQEEDQAAGLPEGENRPHRDRSQGLDTRKQSLPTRVRRLMESRRSALCMKRKLHRTKQMTHRQPETGMQQEARIQTKGQTAEQMTDRMKDRSERADTEASLRRTEATDSR